MADSFLAEQSEASVVFLCVLLLCYQILENRETFEKHDE